MPGNQLTARQRLTVTRGPWLALAAMCLLGGCQGGPDAELIERELRCQEDQIYVLEDYLSECRSLLRRYQAENIRLRHELASASRAAAEASSEPSNGRAGAAEKRLTTSDEPATSTASEVAPPDVRPAEEPPVDEPAQDEIEVDTVPDIPELDIPPPDVPALEIQGSKPPQFDPQPPSIPPLELAEGIPAGRKPAPLDKANGTGLVETGRSDTRRPSDDRPIEPVRLPRGQAAPDSWIGSSPSSPLDGTGRPALSADRSSAEVDHVAWIGPLPSRVATDVELEVKHSGDGNPWPARLQVRVGPRTAEGGRADFEGPISLLLRPADSADASIQYARWDFDTREVAQSWSFRPDGAFICLELPVDKDIPPGQPLELWVRLQPADGRKLLRHVLLATGSVSRKSSDESVDQWVVSSEDMPQRIEADRPQPPTWQAAGER